MNAVIPPPIYAEDIVGDWFLNEADEKLVRTLFRGHAEMMARYYSDPKRRDEELAEEAGYWEKAAHRVWREAGNSDRPTWEILVLLTRESGGEL